MTQPKTTFHLGINPWARLGSLDKLPTISQKNQSNVKTMTKKQTTQATAPATTTAPPGVVSVGKGTIQKRINPGLYDAWLKQRGPGDVLDVEPSKFESVKGHLQRYAEKHGLNWRVTGQAKGAGGMSRIGIEARE